MANVELFLYLDSLQRTAIGALATCLYCVFTYRLISSSFGTLESIKKQVEITGKQLQIQQEDIKNQNRWRFLSGDDTYCMGRCIKGFSYIDYTQAAIKPPSGTDLVDVKIGEVVSINLYKLATDPANISRKIRVNNEDTNVYGRYKMLAISKIEEYFELQF